MAMANCPVCGHSVDQSSAPTAVHNSVTYYFACEGCRSRFLSDPESYLHNARRGCGHDSPHHRSHGCGGHHKH